jgi:uncharacterized protein YdiU (UPF0061 family)
MYNRKLDYTNTFYRLVKHLEGSKAPTSTIQLESWIRQWDLYLEESDLKKESLSIMRKSNPQIIPRNHHVEKAIQDAAQGDFRYMDKLL